MLLRFNILDSSIVQEMSVYVSSALTRMCALHRESRCPRLWGSSPLLLPAPCMVSIGPPLLSLQCKWVLVIAVDLLIIVLYSYHNQSSVIMNIWRQKIEFFAFIIISKFCSLIGKICGVHFFYLTNQIVSQLW